MSKFIPNMRRKVLAGAAAAIFALTPIMASAQTAGCDPSISNAQDTARLNAISGRATLANQTFSQRPASFSDMTCLEKLFSFGGQSMDILFQPPSMSSLLGLIQNFACQAASQYIGQAMGSFSSVLGQSFGGIGGGINTSVLSSALGVTQPGQIIPGVSLGSMNSGSINGMVMQGNNTFSTVPLQPAALFPTAAPPPGAVLTMGQLYGGGH